jgi:hypothetical protein
MPLAFARFQGKGFIDLDEAGFLLVAMVGSGFQETMTPQKGHIIADAIAFGRSPNC